MGKNCKQLWGGLLVAITAGLFGFSALANPPSEPECIAAVCIRLGWEAPTARENGESLDPSELSEYRIYYAPGDRIPATTEPIAIVGGEAISEVVNLDLPPRQQPYPLTFAVTAVDHNGLESDLSNTVTVLARVRSTVPPAPPTRFAVEIRCGEDCVVETYTP